MKSKFFEQGPNNSSEEKSGGKESVPCIKLPPPPSSPGSPVATPQKSPSTSPTKFTLEKTAEEENSKTEHGNSPENESTQDAVDDDFGDFQAAS